MSSALCIPWRLQKRSSSGTTGELLLLGTWLPDIRVGLAAPRFWASPPPCVHKEPHYKPCAAGGGAGIYCFFSFLGYPKSSCVGETERCWLGYCGILHLLGSFSDFDLEQYKESWAKNGVLTAMLKWYRAALLRPSKFALDSDASRVKVPVLLILGKNDQFVGEAMARESLQYCDDGHLEMFETATHWVQHEEPAQVNILLSQFFA